MQLQKYPTGNLQVFLKVSVISLSILTSTARVYKTTSGQMSGVIHHH